MCPNRTWGFPKNSAGVYLRATLTRHRGVGKLYSLLEDAHEPRPALGRGDRSSLRVLARVWGSVAGGRDGAQPAGGTVAFGATGGAGPERGRGRSQGEPAGGIAEAALGTAGFRCTATFAPAETLPRAFDRVARVEDDHGLIDQLLAWLARVRPGPGVAGNRGGRHPPPNPGGHA